MQVEQHARNLKAIRAMVGKARTPKDHEAIGKQVLKAIKTIGCNPNKILYTINNNRTPNLSVRKAIRTKVGTKKIGAGEYGAVFFGCVDKECKKDVAIKIQTESLKSEYEIGKLIQKYGGVHVYAYENCKDKHIMYSEYVNGGALEEFIKMRVNTLRPIHYRTIITQVLYNLYRIHNKYPSFRHSDLHAKNILINIDEPTLKKEKYTIGKIVLTVEDVGIKTFLTDYGLSTTDKIDNPIIEGLDVEWGISKNSNMMYDTHLFLNAMHQVCSKYMNPSCMETLKFIRRIMPGEYIGSKTRKIENFRMRLNADHSNFPTFTRIFSDPYFVPYRKSIKNSLSFIPRAKPIAPKPKPKPKPKQVINASGNKANSAIKRAKAVLEKEAQKKAMPVKRRVVKKTPPPVKVSIAPKGYVRVNGKKCSTYKKKDIVEIAKKAGIDVQGKTIEKICESLKIKYVK